MHFPWCLKKCPYCDFNSHALTSSLPETEYIDALLADLDVDLPLIKDRSIHTIFLGGGTPSLFSASAIKHLLTELKKRVNITKNCEITLEANPGAIHSTCWGAYRESGINRLSIGIQSFQDQKLKELGRIHNQKEAIHAVESAQRAGFQNINLDLMFGLPKQDQKNALSDLRSAIALNPTHISWYQLTIEPNTLFFHRPPIVPNDNALADIQIAGQTLLSNAQFNQYEISAYGKATFQCQHNLNYWQFGDYLGIGAGAHSKITDLKSMNITRLWKIKHPKHYLKTRSHFIAGTKILTKQDRILEFMMNALRLKRKLPLTLFSERTGLSIDQITKNLLAAQKAELLNYNAEAIWLTPLGQQFLNNTLEYF